MNNITQLVSLTLDNQHYALPLTQVERVIHAIKITPLPHAPEIILGVINVHGVIIPVFNMRKRFNLAEREINLNDQFIISNTSQRKVALVVDKVNDVIEIQQNIILNADRILPDMEYIEGVIKLEDGMILIHDLDRFLSLKEKETLDKVLVGNTK